jgi:glyoxylase-like metal-dependent hydrolase (beta-lactamase superfamily II)
MASQIDRLNYNTSHAIEASVRTTTPTTIDRPLRFVNSRDRQLSPSPKLELRDNLRLASSSTGTDMALEPDVTGFYDERTGSVQYIVTDPITRNCAIIDPVLDFDPKSGSTRTTSADRLLRHIEAHGLTLEWILDTHPHADHFSAAGYLKDKSGAPTAIGERVVEVQRLWKTLYNLSDTFPMDGSQWDYLLADGERFSIGKLEARVLLSSGHTLCSITYVIGNAAFVHDTLFMPDSGTARCDFPGGDARQLWRSIQRILHLPAGTRLFTGHDYRPNGRSAEWESSIAAQQAHNVHLRDCDEAKFVQLRKQRDRSLPLPALMLAALQVNIAGGRLPAPEDDGRRYLKIPLNSFSEAPSG